ncbi:MAG TPA: ABC transporter ATP-binding protein, partial [Pseudonocardiaceae bacterium]|nr:ABC transporter ATP-binding protein [Pseudonocardiaceae bacterium]
RDVTVDYSTARGWVPAVRGVSLTLESGQTLGLCGESGCGKSTLAMAVLRLLPKTARIGGQVLVGGRDVERLSWGELRAVRWSEASIVFQGAMHSLNPVQRVGDQIAEAIRLHSRAPSGVRRQVGELLQQVELPARRALAYPHELSGGQKQRVMIAMALACEPNLVIADEPTTALDVVVQAQVLDRFGALVRDRAIGLMMISHDLSVLAATCQRVAVMYDGRIVEEGPAGQIMADPRHPHAKALAAAFPVVGDPASRRVPGPATQNGVRDRPGTAGQDGPPGEGVLAAHDLRVTFPVRGGGTVRAVDGVNLACRPGEIVALVGQSGSGKTTLARCLLGLQPPTAGTVSYDGKPLPTSSRGLRAYRRKVQLVLQDPASALNPRHTVYESVAEGLRIHGLHRTADERELVADALAKAELRPPERFFPALPHELSGGQRQRVVIAGALALAPRFLVADEPVASLDASVRGEILTLLLRLRTDLGLGALVITHDLGLAWNIADRVLVMYRGRLVEEGPVEQVLLDPVHDYTKLLISVLPQSVRRLESTALTGQLDRD